jgi:hypothetical protein
MPIHLETVHLVKAQVACDVCNVPFEAASTRTPFRDVLDLTQNLQRQLTNAGWLFTMGPAYTFEQILCPDCWTRPSPAASTPDP